MSMGLAAVIKTEFDATGINAAAKAFSGFEKDTRNILKTFSTLGTGLLGGTAVIASIKQFGGFIKSTVDMYGQEEAAAHGLEQQLKTMGVTRKSVAKDLLDFAEAMEKSSGAQKEEVIAAETTLTSFGLYGSKLKQTIQAALDMNAALGPNGAGLTTIINNLGKAALGNTSTLSKMGIVISENIPPAQRFDEVLKQIQTRFGGAALESTKTWTGQIDQLHKSFDDAKKTMGEEFMPIAIIILNWLKDFATVANSLIKTFSGVKTTTDKVAELQMEIERWQKILSAREGKEGFFSWFIRKDDKSIQDAKDKIASLRAEINSLLGVATPGNLNKPEEGSDKPTVNLSPTSSLTDADTMKVMQYIEKMNAKFAKLDEDEKRRLEAVAEFDTEMSSERGQAYVAFFGEKEIASKRADVAEAKTAQDAANRVKKNLKQLENEYNKASKTISGGWKQAVFEMQNAGINWKNEFTTMFNSFESNFSGTFWNTIKTAQGVFGVIGGLVQNLFDSILKAFEDLIAQIAAKLVLSGILKLLSFFTGFDLSSMLNIATSSAKGYASGGYTGDGPINEIAGLVHRKEIVIPAYGVSALQQGQSVNVGGLSLAGAGGMGNVNVSIPAININGGISSEMDIAKVCRQITAAAKNGVADAVGLAMATYKVGRKNDGRSL